MQEKIKKSGLYKHISAYKSWYMILINILLLATLLTSIYTARDGTATLDGLEASVNQQVESYVSSLIMNSIEQEYPNLDERYKQDLYEQQLEAARTSGEFTIQGQRVDINALQQSSLDQLKDKFQIGDQTYLLAIDPYFYYRLVRESQQKGTYGEPYSELYVNDTQRLHPTGILMAHDDFHVMVEYMVLSMFGVGDDAGDEERIAALFFLPVWIILLASLPTFFLIKRLSNSWYAFVGSLFVFGSVIVISRTLAGFVDTDAYNIFFPVVLAYCFICALMAKQKWIQYSLLILAGVVQSMAIWAWKPAVYTFLLYIALLAIYLVHGVIHKKEAKYLGKYLGLSIVFTASMFVSYYVMRGMNVFVQNFGALFSYASRIGTVQSTNIWPNVESSIAELNPASLTEVFTALHPSFGKLLFLLAYLGIYYLLTQKKTSYVQEAGVLVWGSMFIFQLLTTSIIFGSRLVHLILFFLPQIITFGYVTYKEKKLNTSYIIGTLLLLWVAGTMYMAMNGVRFILLLAPALGIAFAVGCYKIAERLNDICYQEMKLKYVGSIVLGIFTFGLVITTLTTATAYEYATPTVTDEWVNILEAVQQDNETNKVITSWWDFGHIYAALTDVPVTFDGSTQTKPQAYWVGRSLAENDYEMSLGILRMLSCSGNQAFDYLEKESIHPLSTIKALEEVLPENIGLREKESKLQSMLNISEEQAEHVVSLIACEEPATMYFITSEDMVMKSGVWAHWGSWNFDKRFIYNMRSTLSATQLAEYTEYTEEEVTRLLLELSLLEKRARSEGVPVLTLLNSWFAQYPSYITNGRQVSMPCQRMNTTILCESGIEFDINETEITLTDNMPEEITRQIKRIIYIANGSTIEYEVTERGQIDFALIETEQGITLLPAQYPLGESAFSMLFFAEMPLEHMELFRKDFTANGWESINPGKLIGTSKNESHKKTLL